MGAAGDMTQPVVDVIVPLHRGDRDIRTAVRSAATEVQGVATRVTVVLHNLDADDALRARIGPDARILRLDDGIRSPSGPRNLGLTTASAPFVMFLDSDDALAPRCLARLHEVACATGAALVLPSIHRNGMYGGTPLVATRQPRILDPVQHGLFLRSHVPALLRRSVLDDLGIQYPTGIRSGEDFAVMAQLVASVPTAVAFDAVYEVRDSGDERASIAPLPAGQQLAAVRVVLESSWFAELAAERRAALVRRILAVNLAGGWRTKRRLGQKPSVTEHRSTLALAREAGQGVDAMLSVRDRISLRFELRPGPLHRVLETRPFGLVPSSWRGVVSRRGPFMIELRSFIVRHRPRRSELARF